jgi:hypothetical protein
MWKIEFDADVEKDLRKLGHTATYKEAFLLLAPFPYD